MPNEETVPEKIEVTPEEAQAEQEALKTGTAEEIKAKIAEDLGIDPEEEADLLEKLTKRELTHREKLSGAIKQKISWRDKVKSAQPKAKETPEPGKTQKKETEELSEDERIDRKLAERLEARDLESLDLSEEIKAEVKDLAKLKGISVREASKLPYIISLKEEVDRKARIEAATPKRKGGGTYKANYDPSKPLNPDDFDFDTKEGREAWNDAKAARRKAQEK